MIDTSQSVRQFWRKRLQDHHNNDTYRGRQLLKFPEDLRTYQQVIERTSPQVLVELGTCAASSAMWFHDQMLAIVGGNPLVVTVDISQADIPERYTGKVVQVVGDLQHESVIDRVHELVGDRGPVMVVDDSAHTFDVTLTALRRYSDLVSPGCYFVVEDGIIDVPELTIWSGTGVQPAIVQFLSEDASFTREWLETFGLTMHIGGWLRREE